MKLARAEARGCFSENDEVTIFRDERTFEGSRLKFGDGIRGLGIRD